MLGSEGGRFWSERLDRADDNQECCWGSENDTLHITICGPQISRDEKSDVKMMSFGHYVHAIPTVCSCFAISGAPKTLDAPTTIDAPITTEAPTTHM